MPALALLEIASITRGIRVGDAMVKRAPVTALICGTAHPGKYLVLVEGDVASVEEAVEAGHEIAAETLLDQVFLPDPHPGVTASLRGARRRMSSEASGEAGEALGIVELRSAASLLAAADRGLKGAAVTLRELRLADDLGGKSYCLFQGPVAETEAAVELALESLRDPSLLIEHAVIPRLHDEMDDNLRAGAEFRLRVEAGD